MSELKSPIEARRQKFFELKTSSDLAELLEISNKNLYFVLNHLGEERYTSFEISKRRGGQRIILSPHPALKNLQRRLLQVLETVYKPRNSAYGYIKHRGIVENAKAHRKKAKLRYVLNVDIKDFFPSIELWRVYRLFNNSPYNLPPMIASIIANLCCYQERLPIGAPTSPIIANMICNKLDGKLQRLAQKYRCIYTRYADDITFSTTLVQFPVALAEKSEGKIKLGVEFTQLLSEIGLEANQSKISLRSYSQRQEITGLIVNRFPNVRRSELKNIRAMLYDWEKNGLEEAQIRYETKYYSQKHRFPGKPNIDFRQIVRGKIEFVGMVRGKEDFLYRRFMLHLSQLDGRVNFMPNITKSDKSPQIFISYAREDEEIVKTIYHHLLASGYNPWLDQESIFAGEDWKLAIPRAIRKSDFFLLIASKKSVDKRGYLQREIKEALDAFKEKRPDDIFILPLRLDECELPFELEHLHRIDHFKDSWRVKLKKAIQEGIKRTTS